MFRILRGESADSPAVRGMRPLTSYSDETWDRFFDWIAEGTDDLTDAEVRQELADAGIDMAPAYERLRLMLEKHRRDNGECETG